MIEYELDLLHQRQIMTKAQQAARRDTKRGNNPRNPYRPRSNKYAIWATAYEDELLHLARRTDAPEELTTEPEEVGTNSKPKVDYSQFAPV